MDSHVVSIYNIDLKWRKARKGNSQGAKDDESLFWWLENSPKSQKCMLWLFQSKGEWSIRGKKIRSLSGGCRLRFWFIQYSALMLDKRGVLHLIHLRLLSISVNDSSYLHQLESFIPCTYMRVKILVWIYVVYHLRPLFTSQTFLTSSTWRELSLPYSPLSRGVYLSGHVAAMHTFLHLFFFFCRIWVWLVKVTRET